MRLFITALFDWVLRKMAKELTTNEISWPDPPRGTLETLNNGGDTDYYATPEGNVTLNDLIEYKQMPFWLGEIFKACYRYGEKDVVSKLYEVNKMEYYAKRGKNQLLPSTSNEE